MLYDLAIKNAQVYLDGTWHKTNVYIKDGKFAHIDPAIHDALRHIDANNQLLMPGLIDPHVHFQLDLGNFVSRDDFFHGSKAALYGGVTTIIDFLEPVSDIDGLINAYENRKAEASDTQVDYHFHATIKNPNCDLEKFVLTMKSLGMNSLKLFTTYSESGRRTYDADIIELMQLSEKHGFLLLAHIEADDMITIKDSYTAKDLPLSRPSEAETREALKLAGFLRKYGGKLYMVHLTSGNTLKALLQQYPDLVNKRLFLESCPQYFTFTSEDLQGAYGHLYACAPPLRSRTEQTLLSENFDSLDTIGTDHCAFNRADKARRNLKDMPLGIGSIEQGFDVMYSRFGDRIIDKMSSSVAAIYDLPHKGKIAVGHDADCFLYQQNTRTITTHHGKADYNLYLGQMVSGKVTNVITRGKIRLDHNRFIPQQGRMIAHGKTKSHR